MVYALGQHCSHSYIHIHFVEKKNVPVTNKHRRQANTFNLKKKTRKRMQIGNGSNLAKELNLLIFSLYSFMMISLRLKMYVFPTRYSDKNLFRNLFHRL